MSAPYFKWGMFYRGILSSRGLSIPDVQKLCAEYVHPKRHYRFFKGEREPNSAELKWMEKRMAFNTPTEMLLQEDKFGRQIKHNQLLLPTMKEARR